MTWIEYTALGVSLLIFLIGLASAVLPIVPGNAVVWMGVVVHKLWMGEASVSWKIVILTGLVTLFSLLVDLLLGYWGARKFGASWKGALGALIGAAVALFIPPPLLWLIIGPIIGAVVGELAAGRNWRAGSKAGFGTILGSVLAFGVKFGLSLFVIGLFLLDLVV
ncbi:DUF456 domain-containing protein [Coraliomargarita parva]|uniref:DUF456 domain-containing protein n=1 Tax=Coraliomargarita parva TaxID=3014050 RepID=UPI0022B4CA68|nr:DUF456 family protein [Coraliomargarita parva]